MPLCKNFAGGLVVTMAAAFVAACATPDSLTSATPKRGPNLGATPPAAMLAAMDISILFAPARRQR
jgi:hypothetical protein